MISERTILTEQWPMFIHFIRQTKKCNPGKIGSIHDIYKREMDGGRFHIYIYNLHMHKVNI